MNLILVGSTRTTVPKVKGHFDSYQANTLTDTYSADLLLYLDPGFDPDPGFDL